MKAFFSKVRIGKINILIKSFLLYLSLATIIMVITVTLIYSHLSKKSKYDINLITQETLSNVSYRIKSSMDSVNSYAYQLYNDNSVIQVMKSTNRDIINEIKVVQNLNNIMIFNPNIHSIYIFNSNSAVLKKNNSGTFITETDDELINIIKENERLIAVFRQVLGENGEVINLVTLTYYDVEQRNAVR